MSSHSASGRTIHRDTKRWRSLISREKTDINETTVPKETNEKAAVIFGEAREFAIEPTPRITSRKTRTDSDVSAQVQAAATVKEPRLAENTCELAALTEKYCLVSRSMSCPVHYDLHVEIGEEED